MTDIFFSYKSDDRDRVRLVRDAFVALGFDVFWDQQVPAGVDWDSWIRRHLAESKCAIVFWSWASAASDNVRHEATVAKQQGKLIAALLEPLTAAQFPMGMYSQQAANLVDWRGDLNDAAWGDLRREVETKLVPRWMQQRIDELEAELIAERARREGAESRNKVLRAQIAKEAQGDEDLRHERDKAIDEVTVLRTTVQQLNRALSEAEERTAQESQRANEADSRRQVLERQLEAAFTRAAEAEAQARVNSVAKRSLLRGAIHNRVIISAILLTALMVTGASYVLWQSQPVTAPSSTGVSSPGVPPRRSSEPPSGGGVATPAPPKEVATPAPPKESPPPVASGATGTFTIAVGMEANGPVTTDPFYTPSIGDCQNRCVSMAACGVFSYSKISRKCYLYGTATLSRNEYFDTGTLAQAAVQRPQPPRGAESDAKPAAGAFTITQGMDGNGTVIIEPFNTPSIVECEARCVKMGTCGVFSVSKISKKCYLYRTATLSRNEYFDTGTLAKDADKRTRGAPDADGDSKAATGAFAIVQGMRADGTELTGGIAYSSSPADCENRCTRMAKCEVFSYSEISRYCYLYGTATLKKGDSFVSGTRKYTQRK